jgi:hypothetical protein
MFAVLRSTAVHRLPHRILHVIQTKTKSLTTILSKRHQVLHRERNPRTASNSNCFEMGSFQCALLFPTASSQTEYSCAWVGALNKLFAFVYYNNYIDCLFSEGFSCFMFWIKFWVPSLSSTWTCRYGTRLLKNPLTVWPPYGC